jgi:hypothetical protein
MDDSALYKRPHMNALRAVIDGNDGPIVLRYRVRKIRSRDGAMATILVPENKPAT